MIKNLRESLIEAQLKKQFVEYEKSKKVLGESNLILSQKQNKIVKLETDYLKMKVKNDILEEKSQIRKRIDGRKRKAADPPDDLSQHKKAHHLRKYLLLSLQKAKESKDFRKNLKRSFGIPPFVGKWGQATF